MDDRVADHLDQHTIVAYIRATFSGVDVVSPTEGVGSGDTFFSYDPHRNLDPKQRMPFATIVTKDYGEFDSASDLDRAGVFRLNIGVSRDTFRSLFPTGSSSEGATPTYDYAVLDTLLPHPVYAAQSFVCVLNPSADTFEHTIKPLLTEAYELVAKRHTARLQGR